jgi:hypothetical protein
MRLPYITIIITAVLFAIFLASGCTSSPGSGEPAGNNPLPALQPQTQISGEEFCKDIRYTWAEYAFKTSDGIQSELRREDYSKETYHGQPAIHLRKTTTYIRPEPGKTSTEDLYYNETTGVFLGGNLQVSKQGEIIEEEIGANHPGFARSTPYCPSLENSNFTFINREKVTVPAGTFPDASHYAVWYGGARYELWTAPGVPAIIKFSQAGMVNTELIGWG